MRLGSVRGHVSLPHPDHRACGYTALPAIEHYEAVGQRSSLRSALRFE